MIIWIIRYWLERRRERAYKRSIAAKEEYKGLIEEDYGVNRKIVNARGLICPICTVFADENNVCPKCKRKL
ncbi:MAG: hypothetical protein JW891_04360 [Candidatus Lokiarchaeota archaeon]|nr:hypothetical protein [Candidatus Lokiarchaeota archaeon]